MVKTPKFSFVMHLTITTKIRLYQSCLQFFASEAKRRRRERLRCARELSLRSHGKKNNALEALIIIFRKITSDQKILYFGRRIHFRGEPARHDTTRHGPTVTLTDGLYLLIHCSYGHKTCTKVGYNQLFFGCNQFRHEITRSLKMVTV